MRRSMLLGLLLCFLAGYSYGQNLDPLADDVGKFLLGLTRDMAPNLQMAALSGDLQADATIDKFMVEIPTFGATLSNGIATSLAPGATTWDFGLPMPGIIDSILTDPASKKTLDDLENFFPYPGFKLGFGIGLGKGFDVSVSGIYLWQGITDTIVDIAEPGGSGTFHNMGLQFSTGTIGVKFRKALLYDKGPVPGLSIGVGYTFSDFLLGATGINLSKLANGAVPTGLGDLDMNGSLGIHTFVHTFGFDLQVSKRLLFFTPFVKLSNYYAYSVAEASAKLKAKLTPTSGTPETLKIVSNPRTDLSYVSTFLTTGFDLNLFIFILDTNIVFDLGRAYIDIQDLSLHGIRGNGVSLNVGLRWQPK